MLGRTARMMLATMSLLIPLALTTSPDPIPPPSFPEFRAFHEFRAHVTGFNTVPAQTDSTPCIAASGANICGRHDAVACPQGIKLGTIVEIKPGNTFKQIRVRPAANLERLEEVIVLLTLHPLEFKQESEPASQPD